MEVSGNFLILRGNSKLGEITMSQSTSIGRVPEKNAATHTAPLFSAWLTRLSKYLLWTEATHLTAVTTMCQQKLFCLKSRHVCKCLHFLLTNTRNIIRFEYEHIFQSSRFEKNRDEKRCCAQCEKQRYGWKKKGDLTVLQVPKLGQLQEKQCHLT